MTEDDDHLIVIVSDLHMGAGRDPLSGELHPHEQFDLDGAFARFVDHIVTRAKVERRNLTFALLGDIVDFVRVPTAASDRLTGHQETNHAATLCKLTRIANGHPAVFAALARVASSGFSLRVIPGNHDIEMVCLSSQEAFRNLLIAYGCSPEALDRVTFGQWLYVVPGLLYAEHGQQYHDLNAFGEPLEPFRRDRPDEIALPLGSLLDAYVLDVQASRRVYRAGTRSSTRAMVLAYFTHPEMIVRAASLHARFAWLVLRYFVTQLQSQRSDRRIAYRDCVLRSYARQMGMNYPMLESIDRLAARSVLSPWSRLLRNLLPWSSKPESSKWPRRHQNGSPASTGYLPRAVTRIDQILEDHGQRVPFYVFGHTHQADKRPLDAYDSTPYYLNSGSWTSATSVSTSSGETLAPLTYVEIDSRRVSERPSARIMVWDDALRRCIPLSES